MDDVNDLLLYAVRQGDMTSLERHLLATLQPEKYLTRVYDEEYMQKCTLLTIACLHGHEDIFRVLLERYSFDLEILNNISIGDGDKSQQMCSDVSVLWAAAAVNNFGMVKLLVEHGAHINHTTKTNSTPLRSACYNGNIEMVRYLIEHGADINIVKENNDTNLAVSVYRQHFELTEYLVNELGCDVNLCDNDGRSPLYDAVNCGSLELVQFLLDHGARNFRAVRDQMSPLMWAAEKQKVDIMNAISSHCTLLEQIEAEELLGSVYACTDLECRDYEQALEHLIRALELRAMHNLPKTMRTTTVAIFNHRQECQTVDELKDFGARPSTNLPIEALLIRERLLGSTNSEYCYSLRYHGALLGDNDQHHRCVAFWFYELEIRRNNSIAIDSQTLRFFAAVFSEMLFVSVSIPIEILLTIIIITDEKLADNSDNDFDTDLYTLLYLITITSEYFATTKISIVHRREIYRKLCAINQHRYVTRADGSTLLHLSLNDRTPADDISINRPCKYPSLFTVNTLLQCGADINATDALRNTPLHIFANNMSACDETILKILCDNGAHLDRVNVLKERAIDVTFNVIVQQFLKSRMELKLKCLCAQRIQKHNIPYHGQVSASLTRFIEEH